MKLIADAFTSDDYYLVHIYKNGDKYEFELYTHKPAERQGLYTFEYSTMEGDE